MNDFIFYNPDKVYFGKNQMEHLPEELLQFGKKVLLVYGGGSILQQFPVQTGHAVSILSVLYCRFLAAI